MYIKFCSAPNWHRQIKFSGFRKGVRGRTLFPPEKGFPRVNCRSKLISVGGLCAGVYIFEKMCYNYIRYYGWGNINAKGKNYSCRCYRRNCSI